MEISDKDKHDWSKYGIEGMSEGEGGRSAPLVKLHPYASKWDTIFNSKTIPYVLEILGTLPQVDTILRTYTIVIDRHDRLSKKFDGYTSEDEAEAKWLEEQAYYKLGWRDLAFITPITAYVIGTFWACNAFL